MTSVDRQADRQPARCPVAHRTATPVGIERGPGLLRTGYPYLQRLRRHAGADTAEIRLLGRRTTVVSGAEGARLFYDTALMQREGAIPRPLRRTLFGDGAVHGLDGADHAHRKALFLELLTPAAAGRIGRDAASRWASRGEAPVDPVGVFDAAVTVHCAAVCAWAGVPAEAVDSRLGADLIAMVDGFGSLGRRHLAARRARHRTDRWARRLISRVRGGHVRVAADSPLRTIAGHRGRDGTPLPVRVAGVELLNVLRPTVAVAYFVAFSAHALATEPGLHETLRDADPATLESFAHEVRRRYPFVPMLAARVRQDTEYAGRPLPAGRRVVLDVYGTLHEPEIFPAPERFDAERFRGVDPDPYTFVPQGGGDARTGHRCPGERVAIELIKVAARHLAAHPATSLTDGARIPLNRFPTRPLPKG